MSGFHGNVERERARAAEQPPCVAAPFEAESSASLSSDSLGSSSPPVAARFFGWVFFEGALAVLEGNQKGLLLFFLGGGVPNKDPPLCLFDSICFCFPKARRQLLDFGDPLGPAWAPPKQN